MINYFEIINKSPIFTGILLEEQAQYLEILGAYKKSFKKNDLIFSSPADYCLGIVLSGKINALQIDYSGNQNIIATFLPSDIFGEALFCEESKSFYIRLTAESDSSVIFINYDKFIKAASFTMPYYSVIALNLLNVLASKNIYLNRKIVHITKRSTKEKVMSYLSEQALYNNSSEFTITYDRQELADYLSVDRSALSAELSKLRKAGIINYKRNRFALLK